MVGKNAVEAVVNLDQMHGNSTCGDQPALSIMSQIVS